MAKNSGTSAGMDVLHLAAEEMSAACAVLRNHMMIDTSDPRFPTCGNDPNIVQVVNAALSGNGIMMNIDWDLTLLQRTGINLLILPQPNGRFLVVATRSR